MPAVTVITPAHCRPAELGRAIMSLEAQSFQDWEHIIVHDGPASAEWWMTARCYETGRRRIVELGHHSHRGGEPGRTGTIPALIGTYLARADALCYLPDDDEFYPNHLGKLLAELSQGWDIAYGICDVFQDGRKIGQCGDDSHAKGHIGAVAMMHRWACTKFGNWDEDDPGNDVDLFAKWDRAGLKFGFVDAVVARFNYKGIEP